MKAFLNLLNLTAVALTIAACSSGTEPVEYSQRDGLVVIDAGIWSDSIPAATLKWQPTDIADSDARGARLVNSPSDNELSASTLIYDINFASHGKYYGWVLAKSDAVGSSVTLKLTADEKEHQWQIGNLTGYWQWYNTTTDSEPFVATVDTSGLHELTLTSSSNGIAVARIVMTQNPDYFPVDTGPDSTLAENLDVLDDPDTSLNIADSPSPTEEFTPDNSVPEDSGDGESLSESDNDSTVTGQENPTVAAIEQVTIDGTNTAIAGTPTTVTATAHTTTESQDLIHYYWSMVSGPADVVIESQQSATTSIEFESAGRYRIQVSASQGTVYKNATFDIDVDQPVDIDQPFVASNGAPVFAEKATVKAIAGDQISLEHYATDDGKPAGQLYYFWSQIDGPGTVAFSQENNAKTQAVFSRDGVYKLQLNANDGDLFSNTFITVQVAKKTSTPEIDANDGGSTPPATGIINFGKTWQTPGTSGMAQARHETGGVVVNGKIYIIGGRGLMAIDVYDAKRSKWRKTVKTPFEMHHFQPVALGSKIYLIGGFTCCYPNEQLIDRVYIFDTTNDKWSKGPTIPKNRRRGAAGAVTYNGKIYIVGGNTKGHSNGAVKWFDEFDPDTGKWKTLPDAPDARDHAGAAVVGNKLVFAGGRKSAYPDTFSNTVRNTNVYDFSRGKWQRTKDIPTQRAGAMTVVVGEEVLVIGGESMSQRSAHQQVEAYNVETRRWRNLAPLMQGRHSGTAVTLGDHIHVISGATSRGGSRETDEHEILKFR